MKRGGAITVVIPTYNRAAQVGEAIKSVLNQSHQAAEIIVANDGSTDETVTAVSKFGSSVKLTSMPNRGKSAALNNAINQATGDWIAILDDDDTWTPDKLEWQTKAQTTHPECGVCFSKSVFVNNPAKAGDSFANVRHDFNDPIGRLEDTISYILNPPHGVFIQSCLVAKDLLLSSGGFDENLRVAEDTDMLFRLSLLTSFCYVNRALTLIDRTPIRASGLTDSRRSRPEVYLGAQRLMYAKWLELVTISAPSHRARILRRYAEVHNAWANVHLDRKEYREAVSQLRLAHSLKPRAVYLCKGFLATRFPQLLGWRRWN